MINIFLCQKIYVLRILNLDQMRYLDQFYYQFVVIYICFKVIWYIWQKKYHHLSIEIIKYLNLLQIKIFFQ